MMLNVHQLNNANVAAIAPRRKFDLLIGPRNAKLFSLLEQLEESNHRQIENEMHSQKAKSLEEIERALQYNEPIGPEHEFYTELSDLRGDFEEKLIYKSLHVRPRGGQYRFDAALDSKNKTLLFVSGMRGAGKTTELAKYVQKLSQPEGFICIQCQLGDGLNLANLEYVDILLLQAERLAQALTPHKLQGLTEAAEQLYKWLDGRRTEINKGLENEPGLSAEDGPKRSSALVRLANILRTFRGGVAGSAARAEAVRKALQDHFGDWVRLFNQFVEAAKLALRRKQLAQEVLFIIDGLEQVMSYSTRHRLIVQEAGAWQQVDAYAIVTLPIELLKERAALGYFSKVEMLPFVQLYDREGTEVEAAFERLAELVYRRIAPALFEDGALVRKAIRYSGGSPRELLRILELAAFFADEERGLIAMADLDKALARLANQSAQHLTEEMIEKLKAILRANERQEPIAFDAVLEDLLEKNLAIEYYGGNYKWVNPLLELSDLYPSKIEAQLWPRAVLPWKKRREE
jgi:hypothetical protein